MSTDNLRKALKEGKLIMGTEETIKAMKRGKVKEVFIAKNCPQLLRREIKNYAEISGANVVELDETNEDIGAICKKPFSINICSY